MAKLADYAIKFDVTFGETEMVKLKEAFDKLAQSAPSLQEALNAYGVALAQLGPLSQPSLPGMEPNEAKFWAESYQPRPRRKPAKPKSTEPAHHHAVARRKLDLE